jgi:deazaflavin-dependent oxidoreductase (nitroreductase family)
VYPQLHADPSPNGSVGVSWRVVAHGTLRQPGRSTVPFVPLRYVDPHQKRGPLYGANVAFGRSRAGQFVARHVARHTDPHLFRLTGGRVNMGAIITAPLASTGAKSGEPREVQLTYFHDGPDVILLASNYGGSNHPNWYYNLKTHPECKFGGESCSASRVTDASEYARLFELAERIYAGYGDYRAKTAPIGREIPILRLRPR